MHVFETPLLLRHTDAAGVVFFARWFELAHDAYEDMLRALGCPLPPDLLASDMLLPLVHASCDYRAALRMGERLRIEVELLELKARSFTLGHRFVRSDGVEAARLKTVHVAVDLASGAPRALPERLVEALRSV